MSPRVAKFTVTIAGLILLACSSNVEPPTTAPQKPSDPFPADSAANQASSLELRWKAAGSSKDVTYDLYFGESTPLPRIAQGLARPQYVRASLAREAHYFWRVVAVNGAGRVRGNLWQFTTTAGHAPDAPSNPDPSDGVQLAVDQIVLGWVGSDADQDTLSYDVYFGQDPSPPIVAQGIAASAITLQVRQRGLYYWRVVARDPYGLSTSGPTWTFEAIPIPGHVYNWGGTGEAGYALVGQAPGSTPLYWPMGVAFSPGGKPYVVDWNHHRIIAPDAGGYFRLVAGTTNGSLGDPCAGYADCQNVPAAGAALNHPTAVGFDPLHTDDMILMAWQNSEIFRLHMSTGLMDRICGDGLRAYNGDEQPAATAEVDLPASVAFDPVGRLVFADQANQIIRMIDENRTIHSIAGTPPIYNPATQTWQRQPGYGGDGGPAVDCHFYFEVGQVAYPSGMICYDASGNLYIADSQNNCVRCVDTSGIIRTCAGNYALGAGYSGDGGPATSAQLNNPRDVAVDGDGNLFIADTRNAVIRMVSTSGVITTVAGTYQAGGGLPIGSTEYAAEDGLAAADIHLVTPYGVTVDGTGRVWITDTGNHAIRILYR